MKIKFIKKEEEESNRQKSLYKRIIIRYYIFIAPANFNTSDSEK